jgi:TPR repeat protein
MSGLIMTKKIIFLVICFQAVYVFSLFAACTVEQKTNLIMNNIPQSIIDKKCGKAEESINENKQTDFSDLITLADVQGRNTLIEDSRDVRVINVKTKALIEGHDSFAAKRKAIENAAIIAVETMVRELMSAEDYNRRYEEIERYFSKNIDKYIIDREVNGAKKIYFGKFYGVSSSFKINRQKVLVALQKDLRIIDASNSTTITVVTKRKDVNFSDIDYRFSDVEDALMNQIQTEFNQRGLKALDFRGAVDYLMTDPKIKNSYYDISKDRFIEMITESEDNPDYSLELSLLKRLAKVVIEVNIMSVSKTGNSMTLNLNVTAKNISVGSGGAFANTIVQVARRAGPNTDDSAMLTGLIRDAYEDMNRSFVPQVIKEMSTIDVGGNKLLPYELVVIGFSNREFRTFRRAIENAQSGEFRFINFDNKYQNANPSINRILIRYAGKTSKLSDNVLDLLDANNLPTKMPILSPSLTDLVLIKQNPHIVSNITRSQNYTKGMRYYWGRDGVERNFEEAFKWFNKASQEGDSEATAVLAYLYFSGNGVKVDNTRSFELSIDSAKNNSLFGKFVLGNSYFEGIGTEKNIPKAQEMLKKIYPQIYKKAISDEPFYQIALAFMLDDGAGIKKDSSESFKWALKVAQKGHRDFQNRIGYMYNFGKGIEKNLQEAVRWYRKSAENGSQWGQYNLGDRYYFGEGVSQGYENAIHWFMKSASQDNAHAQNDIGYMYDSGKGVEKNSLEAFKWYRKSAENGYHWGQYNLGKMYYDGTGIEQNTKEAFNWYLKAANQENKEAQYQIAEMYTNEEIDLKYFDNERLKWLKKAATNGHATAQAKLGIEYDGNNKIEEAIKLIQKSANQNNYLGQFYLGRAYLTGRGVPKDQYEALNWYRKSAAQGFNMANGFVKDLEYELFEDN